MIKIEISPHAINQKDKRNTDYLEILETIRHPDEIINSYRGKLYRKKYNDKTLEVVTKSENDIIIVITQYYLEL